MFLHADIQSVGNNAFEGCTAMTALIFEGTKATGTGGISLGTGIITGTYPDIKIFLPAITDPAVATAYKTLLEQKPTYYNFAGYGSATTTEEKTNPASYTLIPTVPVETMQFTVKVESGDLKFNIPFPESGVTPAAIMVSWGDGTPVVVVPKGTTLAAGDKFEYTYAAAGTYIITIGSDVTADKQQIPVLKFEQRTGSYNTNKLVSLETALLNMDYFNLNNTFKSCEKLTTIPGNLFEKNTMATNFSFCFSNCSSTQLTTIPEELFAKNTAAENFSRCFQGCEALKTIKGGLFANNKKATDFSYCFDECSELQAIPEGLFANNTEATDFGNCFSSCYALQTIPGGLFANNKKATSFSECFSNCHTLATIPEGLFAKNTMATKFSFCFSGCIKMKLNANIFVDPTATEEEKLNRFMDKSMDFRYCFKNFTENNTTSGIAPALWNYAKGSGQWQTENCFTNCKVSNHADVPSDGSWGTPKAPN